MVELSLFLVSIVLFLGSYPHQVDGCLGGRDPPVPRQPVPPRTVPAPREPVAPRTVPGTREPRPVPAPREPPSSRGPTAPETDLPAPAGPPKDPLIDDFGNGAAVGRPDDSNKVPLRDVEKPEDLSCDFEKRRSCCWQTITGPPGKPQFRKAVRSRRPYDELSIQKAFGTDVGPTGNFLFAKYTPGTSSQDVAELRSCTVKCVNGTDFKLTLKHWSEDPARLRVCLRDPFDARAQYSDCDEAPLFSNPGPTTFELVAPSETPFDVIIVADNLGRDEGRLVAIDEITASFTPCDAVEPPKKGSPLCPAECNFDRNKCQIKIVRPPHGDPQVTTTFERTNKETYGNEDTGCPRPPNSKSYLATKLSGNQVAIANVNGLRQQPGKDLSFMYYEATKDIHLEFCKVDSKRKSEAVCQDVSRKDVKLDDRRWQNARVTMDGKFDRIEFKAISAGEHIGSVCIDDILVVNTRDPPFGIEGPPKKSKPVCK